MSQTNGCTSWLCVDNTSTFNSTQQTARCFFCRGDNFETAFEGNVSSISKPICKRIVLFWHFSISSYIFSGWVNDPDRLTVCNTKHKIACFLFTRLSAATYEICMICHHRISFGCLIRTDAKAKNPKLTCYFRNNFCQVFLYCIWKTLAIAFQAFPNAILCSPHIAHSQRVPITQHCNFIANARRSLGKRI